MSSERGYSRDDRSGNGNKRRDSRESRSDRDTNYRRDRPTSHHRSRPEGDPRTGGNRQYVPQQPPQPSTSGSVGFSRTANRSPDDSSLDQQTKRRRTEDPRSSAVGVDPSPAGDQRGAAAGAPPVGDGNRRNARAERDLDIVRTVPVDYFDATNTKSGTTGKEVKLTTNYFTLKRKPNWCLYQYRVDFTPEPELLGIRRRLMFMHKQLLGGYLYDTRNTIYLVNKLEQNPTVLEGSDRDENVYSVSFRLVGIVSMETSESLQVLNVILRRAMDGLQLQLIGRNFFDPKAVTNLPQAQLQLWPGYMTSIRQHETDVMLCAEITNKVMRTETIHSIMTRLYRESGNNFRTAFQQEVLGMTVLTDYNNKTYRIDDVDFTTSPSDTFDLKGTQVSFIEYYAKKYHITIRDPQQPMLISRARQRDLRGGAEQMLALVPELCRATGLSESQRGDFRLMRNLAGHFRIAPQSRIDRLNDFNRRLQNTPASVDVLNDFNMVLDKALVQVEGRTLNPEKIYAANTPVMATTEKASWDTLFHKQGMLQMVPLENWVILYPYRSERETNDLLKNMMLAAKNMNYSLNMPQRMSLNEIRNHTLVAKIEEALAYHNPQLVMVVVPNNNADMYAQIKKKCCLDRFVPSQVICLRTLKNPRGLLSIATKVVVQLNCKVGGAPWSVHIPLSNTMTVGFDVTHDTNDKSRSFGALVAMMGSTNNNGSDLSFFSAVSQHRNGEELSNDFCFNMMKAVHEHKRKKNCLPTNIIVYRDGVGEGQTRYVYEHEVEALKTRLQQVYDSEGLTYKLAFIIVSKRINTRFFANKGNPLPGTVVDSVVTLPERYDFFIVSQSVGQGTVSPTSYNVLFNNTGLKPDIVQRFTYKMTHMYFNWMGTVRVPAVCQLAHKLAFLVGQCLHQAPESQQLEKLLYFL